MKQSLFLLLFFSLSSLMAQEKSAVEQQNLPEAKVAVTQQKVVIDGQAIPLTAKAGTMQLRDENNEPIALFGFTYYAQKDAGDNRPIVFAYNGGPGSSSFWLHMGVLGPKRIVVNDPEYTRAAPYQLVNNEHSILAVADLVMMDPIGTGLSVPVGKADFKDFWGVDQDIRSIGLFITQFLIQEGRMNHPKFLLGESYGTLRNAGVMNHLLQQGIAMNGVIMVSAVFDLRTLIFPPEDDLPYLLHFPTYAATAWYHNQISDKPENVYDFLEEVREFTEREYLPALFKGTRISTLEKQAVAEKLGQYTGTSAEYWLQANLRVTNSEFFAEALRDQGKVVGRLDSRYTGIQLDGIAQTGSYDPQSAAISPAYIAGFLHYLHEELKVDKDQMYTITAGRRPGFKWDWSHQGNSRWGTQAAINTAPDMATALSQDPNMKVLILNGIYDLATVFYGVEHTIDHLGLPWSVRKNITMKYYEAGHMMYTDPASLTQFTTDVNGFIREVAGQ